jgi:hypothetical protein
MYNASITNLSASNASIDNASIYNGSMFNASITNLSASNSSLYNASIYNGSIFNASITNLSASNASIYNASIYNGSVFNASITNLSASNASVYNASIYNGSVYNASITNLSASNASIYNASIYNGSIFNASITNLSASNSSIYNASIYNGSVFNASITNLSASNASLYNASINNGSIFNASITNLSASVANIVNVISPNIDASSTQLTIGGTNATSVVIGNNSNITNILGKLQIASSEGSAGQVLTSNGTNTIPTWNSLSTIGFGWIGTANSNLSMGVYSIIGSSLDSSGTNLTIGGTTAESVTIGKASNITNILGNLQIAGSAGEAGKVLTSNATTAVWSDTSWVGTATSNLSMGTNTIICNTIDASATSLTIGGGVTSQGVTLGKALYDTNILGYFKVAGSAGNLGQVLRSTGSTAEWVDYGTATANLEMGIYTITGTSLDSATTLSLGTGTATTTTLGRTTNTATYINGTTINLTGSTVNIGTTTTNVKTNNLWGATSTIPIGGIIMYSGTWPPDPSDIDFMSNMYRTDCWILCDGGATYTKPSTPLPYGISNYTNTGLITNNNLVITLSNSNQKTIKIPDLRGRFVMGYVGNTNFAYSGTIQSVQTTNQQLVAQAATNQTGAIISGVANYPGGINNFGGVMTQALSVSEMPSHLHTIPSHSHTMQHTHQIRSNYASGVVSEQGTYLGRDNGVGGGGGRQVVSYLQDINTGAFNPLTAIDPGGSTGSGGSGETGNKGGADSRSNLPPYWVLAYIMRIG